MIRGQDPSQPNKTPVGIKRTFSSNHDSPQVWIAKRKKIQNSEFNRPTKKSSKFSCESCLGDWGQKIDFLGDLTKVGAPDPKQKSRHF